MARLLLFVVAIAGGLAAVIAVIIPPILEKQSSDPPPVPAATISASSSSSARPSADAATPSGAGSTCWTSARAPVDCQLLHSYELLSTDPEKCTGTKAIEFMGGVVGLDVTAAHADSSTFPGSCMLVSSQAGRGSARDVLAQDDSAAWRQCLDSKRGTAGTLVTCDEKHDVEYLATGSLGQATTHLCEDRSAAYTGKSWGSVSDVLQVRFVRGDARDETSPRCALSPRQPDGYLGVLLRRLGRRQVVIS